MRDFKDLLAESPFTYYVEGTLLVCDLRSLVPTLRTKIIQELRVIFGYSNSKSPRWSIHCFTNDDNSISTPMTTTPVKMLYSPFEGAQNEQTFSGPAVNEYRVHQVCNDSECVSTESPTNSRDVFF